MKFHAIALAGALLAAGAVLAQDADEPTLAERTETLAAELSEEWQAVEAMAQTWLASEGDERHVRRAQVERQARALRSDLEAMVSNIVQLREDGADVSGHMAVITDVLTSAHEILRTSIEQLQSTLSELHEETPPAEARLEHQQQVTELEAALDRTIGMLRNVATYTDALGLDAEDQFAYLDSVVRERADELAARLEIGLTRRDEENSRLARATTPEERQAIEPMLGPLREQVHSYTTSLQAMVRIMDEREIDATAYKELLVQSTGVTEELLDVQVMANLASRTWNQITKWLADNAVSLFFRLVVFVAVLAVARVLAGVAKRIVVRTLSRTDRKVPVLFKDMVVSMSSKIVMVLGLILALSQVGIEVGPLLAGLGVVGFIVGFALQDTLSNFASGVMILFYSPFDVDDVVEAGGVNGVVRQMSLVSTSIRTFDNQVLIVPNNKIWGDIIRNKTAERIRRVDMDFGIGYESDIPKAEAVLHDLVTAHELVLDDPPPLIRLNKLNESSVDFIVRPWTKTENYWKVFWDITREVKMRFDAEGISIPFPQRDVHLIEASNGARTTTEEESPEREALPEVQPPASENEMDEVAKDN